MNNESTIRKEMTNLNKIYDRLQGQLDEMMTRFENAAGIEASESG